jgi:hypothetical protein
MNCPFNIPRPPPSLPRKVGSLSTCGLSQLGLIPDPANNFLTSQQSVALPLPLGGGQGGRVGSLVGKGSDLYSYIYLLQYIPFVFLLGFNNTMTNFLDLLQKFRENPTNFTYLVFHVPEQIFTFMKYHDQLLENFLRVT